jgi:hypothetical protein
MKNPLASRWLPPTVAILSCLVLVLGLALQASGQAKPKDSYILKGSPLGGVKFEHKLHTERASNK